MHQVNGEPYVPEVIVHGGLLVEPAEMQCGRGLTRERSKEKGGWN